MKLLIVAMSESIHTARWISNIADQGHEVILFPSIREDSNIHKDLRAITIYNAYDGQRRRIDRSVSTSINYKWYLPLPGRIGQFIEDRIRPKDRASLLELLIKKERPDVIHTMESQHAGYLLTEARKRFSGEFPVWIHSCWGIDLHFYGQLEEHRKKLKDLLSFVDIFIYEGERDRHLADHLGFKGKSYKIPSVGGGFDVEAYSELRKRKPTSERRIILLKGYQNEVRRALFGLRALERCSPVLSDYEIVIYSTSPEVVIKAEMMTKATGMNIRILPRMSHDALMSVAADARISLTVNLSDGVPNSMLEAMIVGAFPIQSWTSSADEWIDDGVNGILVPPEDPDIIERAVRRAISDDILVDRAAEINFNLAKERLNSGLLKSKIADIYHVAEAKTKK